LHWVQSSLLTQQRIANSGEARLPGTSLVCKIAHYEHFAEKPERDDARDGLLPADA